MNQNMIDCEQAERDAGMCGCKEGSSLEILKDVHKMYEEKMARIDRSGGGSKLQLQVDVFRSWVSDLVAQNTLLAKAVEELEAEATTKLIHERKRHSESSSSSARMNELNESLKVDIMAKDREIRKLTKDVQQHEQTIINMTKERSCSKCNSLEVSKVDAGVMCMRWAGNECGDWEPGKDYTEIIQDETQFQERIQDKETKLKSSSKAVWSLLEKIVSVTEELETTRLVCSVLFANGCVVTRRSQLKDDIIQTMRRKLRHLKAKLAEVSQQSPVTSQEYKNSVSDDGECPRRSASYEAVTIECVRKQPRENRDGPTPSLPAMSRNHDHDNVISRNRTEREGLVCGCTDTDDLNAGNTDCDVSCHRNTGREVFVRGNTIFANVVYDNFPCELARGSDCGFNLSESGDHGPSNFV